MVDRLSLRLFSCLGVEDDLPLLGHFLAHYAALGVPCERMHFILQASCSGAPGLEAARDMLATHGISAAEIWIGPYTSGEMWKRRQALQTRVADAHDWVISADIDEFHEYPAPLEDVLRKLEGDGVTVLQGPFIDRITPGGLLRPVDPDRPLEHQFPIEADVMCPIGKDPGANDATGTVKMMAFRGRILPDLGGHNPLPGPGIVFGAGQPLAAFNRIKEAEFRFCLPALVHHYKWTDGLIERLRRRRDTAGASVAGSKYGTRLLDYLEARNGRIRLRDIRIRRDVSPWHQRLKRLRDLEEFENAKAGGKAERAQAEPKTPAPPASPTAQCPPSRQPPQAAPGWRIRQLTHGSEQNRFHSHSYYDIRIADSDERFVAAHEMTFQDRWMKPDDTVLVGLVDLEKGGFDPVGETTAWSWQQGPLAQWIPRRPEMIWNIREGKEFVSRVYNRDTSSTRALPRTVYAVDPTGSFALSLNMARLDKARPGYGYTGGAGARLDESAPQDDGVWRMELDTGACRLILPLARAVELLHRFLPAEERAEHRGTPQVYWFNHVKLSPDGKRFTIKLRWRVQSLEKPWRGRQSVSLTCGIDGRGLRVLIRGGSHVMWLDESRLFCWDQPREKLALLQDEEPRGRHLRDIQPNLFNQNVHIHHLPERPGHFLYDVPYSEEVKLAEYEDTGGNNTMIATFENHIPKHGPFRCDLHPVPYARGTRIIVTSLHDGGRQLYAVEREDATPDAP